MELDFGIFKKKPTTTKLDLSLLYVGTIDFYFLLSVIFYAEAKSTRAKEFTEEGKGTWKSEKMNNTNI